MNFSTKKNYHHEEKTDQPFIWLNSFLAATSTLQCVWTVPLALLNVYTLLSGQWPLENHHWIAGIAAITGDRVSKCKSIVHHPR
jgi:hypothetical protein